MSIRIKTRPGKIELTAPPKQGETTLGKADLAIHILTQQSRGSLSAMLAHAVNEDISPIWKRLSGLIEGSANLKPEEKLLADKTAKCVADFFPGRELTSIHEIGSGRFGSVYQLKFSDNSSIALKVQNVHLDSDHLEKYIHYDPSRGDSLLCSSIPSFKTSPNGIIYYGAHNTQIALLMPFIEGETLRKVLKNSFSLQINNLEICLKIAENLKALHDLSIEHRDLKPENILIGSDGDVALIDFGIAKRYLTGAEPESPTGTEPYKAPEREAEKRLGGTFGQADIWSLGLLFCDLLGTGERPFASYVEVLTSRYASKTIRDILNPDILEQINPPAIRELIVKMLDLKKRPSIDQIIEELRSIISTSSPVTSTTEQLTIATASPIDSQEPTSDS